MSLKTPEAQAPAQMQKNGAVPDSNTLLAYKLLKDSWPNASVFENLMKNEMKYLVAGVSLLENDPYLAMKMGGVTLNAAGQLASVIKQKEQEIDINSRIEPVAKSILLHKFSKPQNIEMLPGRRKAITLTRNANNRVAMEFKASEPANTALSMAGVAAPNTLQSTLGDGAANAAVYASAFGGINTV